MKKTNSMRVAVAMLALTLITSCFVGGTFAKYTTYGWGGDSARVAKFGVVIDAGKSAFLDEYETDDDSYKGEFSVKSDNGDNVVAPGTSGEVTLFSISGTPEVAVKIDATLNNNDKLKLIYHTLQGITFDNPTIEDWIHGVTISENTPSGDTTPEAGAAGTDDLEYFCIQTIAYSGIYYPIVWTLKKDNAPVCVGNLAYINQYIEDLSGVYAPNTDLSEAFGTYTLAWEWKYELSKGDYHPGLSTGEDYLFDYYQDLMNTYDTELGDLMAKGAEDNPEKYSLKEEFSLSVTVTQID